MNPKQQLEQLLRDLKTKQFREGEAKGVVENIQEEFKKAMAPAMQELAAEVKESIREASKELRVEMPEIPAAQVSVEPPVVNIPAPVVNVPAPIVNVPAPVVNIPETKFPEYPQFPSDFALRGVDNKSPLPVLMMGMDGKPMSFPVSMGGGGKADFLTIKDIRTSSGASLIDQVDGTLKVSGSFSAATTPFATYYASDAVGSVNVVDAFGSTAVSSVFNADNRIRVSVETGGSGLTDSELRASHLDVQQLSGAIDSVYVTGVAASFFADVQNPDGRVKVELPSGSSGLTDTELRAAHLDVQQVSGAIDSVKVTGFDTSVGATFLNGDGNSLDPRDRNWTIAETVPISTTQSIEVKQVSGISFSATLLAGSAAIGSVNVNGTLNSTITVGDLASDAADTGSAPVKIGAIARTANPTAVAAGDRVSLTADDLGRQVVRNVQVRDLIQTAYVSVTNGTETTLRAGVAGALLDLIMIVGSNNSDAAVSVDIRPVTGGNIVNTLRIPANGTAGWTPPVPWPQSDTGNNWTVDGPDETGRTLTFSALFSQEI